MVYPEHIQVKEGLTTDRAGLQSTSLPFEILYGTGEVAGVVAYEQLTLGSPALTIPKQGFGAVYDSSADFLSASCDGLFVRAQNRAPPTLFPENYIWAIGLQ